MTASFHHLGTEHGDFATEMMGNGKGKVETMMITPMSS